MHHHTYRLLLLVVVIATGGCITLRTPPGPDTAPLAAPAAEGTVQATFTDMITETPISYTVTMPNPGGRFASGAFAVSAATTGLDITASPTLHFKAEEPLYVYVARFFNVRVAPFAPLPETDVLWAANADGDKHYLARAVTVGDQDGYLVVEFRGGGRVNLDRYTGWFVAMVAGAEVARAS